MTTTMTCIACPRGCQLEVQKTPAGLEISGHRCPKGLEYARQETLQPLRILTTTVRTDHPDMPRLPVRLSREIPLPEIPDYMKVINAICVSDDCHPGDIITSDLRNNGVHLVATGVLEYER